MGKGFCFLFLSLHSFWDFWAFFLVGDSLAGNDITNMEMSRLLILCLALGSSLGQVLSCGFVCRRALGKFSQSSLCLSCSE
ncbi:hypothetical protein BJ166DRAFT_346352 [Pestalotiopsis sp. NC0098]|nr:hypothetical protein BJ166DRAFT_346352 [Pestalotiopsis sp. NC0098]